MHDLGYLVAGYGGHRPQHWRGTAGGSPAGGRRARHLIATLSGRPMRGGGPDDERRPTGDPQWSAPARPPRRHHRTAGRRSARWRLRGLPDHRDRRAGWVTVRGLTGSFVYYLTPTDISVEHKAAGRRTGPARWLRRTGQRLHRQPSALRFMVTDGVNSMRVLEHRTGAGDVSCRAGRRARGRARQGRTVPLRHAPGEARRRLPCRPSRAQAGGLAEDGTPGAGTDWSRAGAVRLWDGRRVSRRAAPVGRRSWRARGEPRSRCW